jgi:hypothetical protein
VLRVLIAREARRAVGSPIRGDGRPVAAGGSRARFSPGGRGVRVVSVARPLAAGLRAQVAVWRPAAGCFHI